MLSSGSIQNLKIVEKCDCYKVIHPDDPHKCNQCKRNFSACLYINELQHKITKQAIEIDQLKNDLKANENEVRRQRIDLKTLNMKYIAGTEKIVEIQQQKEMADRELEELSARLFEEANNMVANEKRKQHQLEEQLRFTEDQLITEQSQLNELRNRIETATTLSLQPPPPYFNDDAKKPITATQQIMRLYNENNTSRSSSSLEYNINTRLLFNEIRAQQNALIPNKNDINSTVPNNYTIKYDETNNSGYDYDQILQHPSDSAYFSEYDMITTNKAEEENNDLLFGGRSNGVQFDHFRNFVEQQQKTRSSSVPSLISDSSTDEEEEHYYSFFHSSSSSVSQQQPAEFIVRSEIEDIEPCLQFGSSNSRMCIKTMMDHMSLAPCFIESITLEEARNFPSPMNAISTVYYRPIWERLTASTTSLSSQFLECTACGVKCEIKKAKNNFYYRFRLTEKEDWLLIDRDCRDRLVAVCNFYSFIRNIQLGYYKQRPLHDLYLENVELRLKMFYSR